MLIAQQELPQVFGFGSIKQTYPVRKSAQRGSTIMAVLFILGAVAVFGYGLINTFSRWQKYGSAIILKTISGPLILSVILFLLGLLLAWTAYSNSKKLVVVYDQGFINRDRRGVVTCRWEEADALLAAVTRHYTNGIYTGTTHVYTITKTDGTKIVINDTITNVEAAANQIRQSIYPLLYQKKAQAYNSGQRLVFGPVSLSKVEGVTIGKKTFPWDQISQVKINKGYLNFAKKGGGWFSGATAAVSLIPNLEVLLSIIDQVVGIKVN
jgi:hypothetical protein